MKPHCDWGPRREEDRTGKYSPAVAYQQSNLYLTPVHDGFQDNGFQEMGSRVIGPLDIQHIDTNFQNSDFST